ncbi:histidine kinase [Lachnospiraceae bacterium 29-91]
MGNISIKYRLFLSYSVLVILSLLGTVVVSQSFFGETFRKNMMQDHHRELTLITNSLQSDLNHIVDYEQSVALDSIVMTALQAHPSIPDNEAEYNDMRRRLGKTVNSIIGGNPKIFQWDIITLDNQFLHVSGYDLLNPIQKALGENYFSRINARRGIILEGPFMIENTGTDAEAVPVFVMSRQIVELDTLKPLGYVAFFLFEESLASVFENNMPADIKLDFFILSEENDILSSSKKERIGKSFEETQKLGKCGVDELLLNGTYQTDSGRDSILYTVTYMEQNGWKVVYAAPMEGLMASQYYVRGIVLAIGVAACVVSMLMAGCIAVHITKPIVELSKKMSTYYANRPPKDVSYTSRNEIRNLYAGFEDMVKDSRALIKQIYDEQEEKSNYKFQLIQAQIKPHFLYNTFETIKSLIDIGMSEEASEAVIAISGFYRMSLNDGNDIISVAGEVEMTRQYMYIQKLRYMDCLDYQICECKGLDNYTIPKLTLQPLLENSIYHGIKPKQEEGKIRLDIIEEEDCLIFVIEDNGVGIDREKLDNLNRILCSEEREEAESFGIHSINRRIRLFFGEEYGLVLESEKDVFTRVTLTIPKNLLQSRIK